MMAQLSRRGDLFPHRPMPWPDSHYTRPTDSPDTVEHISSFSNPSAFNSMETFILPESSSPSSETCVSPFSHFLHDPFQQSSTPSEARAQAFLQTFLSAHPLSHGNAGTITVIPEAVPTMEELESYGRLSEEEGTRRCRRMFKAPVIWDELGHAVWKMLRQKADEREQSLADMDPMQRVDATFVDGAPRPQDDSLPPWPQAESFGPEAAEGNYIADTPSRRSHSSMYRRIPGVNAFKAQSWSASSDGRRRDREKRRSLTSIRKFPSAPETSAGPSHLVRRTASEQIGLPRAETDGAYGTPERGFYKCTRERRATIPRMVLRCQDVVRKMFGESS